MTTDLVRQLRALSVLLISVVVVSCAPGLGLRDAHQAQSDRWGDVDSQRVAQTLINEMLVFSWYDDFVQDFQSEPVVMVYGVRDAAEAPFAMADFIHHLEQAVLQSGQLLAVTPNLGRTEFQSEDYVRNDALQTLGQDFGADFVLAGEVRTASEAADGSEVITYFIELRLLSVANGQEVWLGLERVQKQRSL